MWGPAFPVVLLTATRSFLCEASPAVRVGLSKTLTLPVKENYVTVDVSGQRVDLLLDSGFSDLSVVDGHWFEEKYGKGSCSERPSGCYFCPKEEPCSFGEDELVVRSRFGGGVVLESIIRSGVLTLDGQSVRNFTFRVSRYTVWDVEGWRPWGHFGIAALPPQSPPFYHWPNRESVLDALKRNDLIGRLSYTVVTQRSHFTARNSILGELTLGDAPEESEMANRTLHIAHHPVFNRSLATLLVSSVEVLGKGENLSLHTEGMHPKAILTILDTGHNTVGLPYPGFEETVLNAVGGLRAHGYDAAEIAALWWRDKQGFLWLRGQALAYLPVPRIRLGDESKTIPIELHPEHYCGKIVRGEVGVYVRYKAVSGPGTPLFKARAVHVDYSSHRMALLDN
ncbi:hypothetical protein FOZ63_025650 [Perkinsus olseni]|uniref:Uncharacterized protein n=1 Tax=Perkinsus olseni TaxID=32597 RepID=A0A7J6RVU4_PEROL|nr:hypothetical protein FOZ63_025650 [Perkinsus olseni]